MNKKLRSLLWLLVALLALAFLVWRTARDEQTLAAFKKALDGLNWGWAIAAVGLYLISQTALAARWIVLLKVHNVHISLWRAIRLTYLGLFYNNMMPGTVGGDLLKGWYITHHSPQNLRLEAAVTVLVDRLIGLTGMIFVAALASLCLRGDMPDQAGAVAVQKIRWLVWAVFAAMLLGAAVFLSRHVHKVLLIGRLIEKLPLAEKLRQIDQAIRIYRRHPRTVFKSLVLTVLIQGLAIVAIYLLTQALHFSQVTFLQCLIIMPIVWVISAAIPVPGGLGITENCITYLFCLVINPQTPDAAVGQAAALALLIRIMICICSLPGALVPIFGGHLPQSIELQKNSNLNAYQE